MINIYWIGLYSLSIIIYVLNWCPWWWVKALWYRIGWISYGFEVVRWNYTSIMLWFVWSPYGGSAIWIDFSLSALLYEIWWSRPCRQKLKYFDDLCSWLMWCMSISIYMLSNMKVCVLSMYVRKSLISWLCACMCSHRVDALLFLLDYMSL